MKSLCDLCIETLSRNLDMYDCLENLPEFIRTKILSTMKNFFFKRLGKLNNDSVVGYLTILQTQGPVTALNLPWCNRITDDGIHNITQELTSLCNNLTTINLSYCSNVSDGSIQNVCKVCPNIKSIDLTFTAVGDRGIGALVQYSTQSLERLTLEQCSNVTDAGIQILARGFKRGRLTHLNLGGLKKVSNVGIQILASHLKSLRSLSLSGCDCLIDYDIEDICKTLVLLEEFNLRCCWRLTDTSIRHIARMARKQLGTKGTKSGSGSSSSSKRNGPTEKELQQRRKRVIEGGSASSARSGFGICLKYLDLGGCKRITSRGIICLAKSAKHLEKLDLRGLGENVTDDTLGVIRGQCTELSMINVQGCSCTLYGIDLLKERGIDVVGGTAKNTTFNNNVEAKTSDDVQAQVDNGHK